MLGVFRKFHVVENAGRIWVRTAERILGLRESATSQLAAPDLAFPPPNRPRGWPIWLPSGENPAAANPLFRPTTMPLEIWVSFRMFAARKAPQAGRMLSLETSGPDRAL